MRSACSRRAAVDELEHEFSTLTPHWFGVIDGAVELIAILGPQGERLHLHA